MSKASSGGRSKLLWVFVAIVIVAVLAGGSFFGVRAIRQNQVVSYIDAGNRYLEEGNYQQAILEYSLALEIDPRNISALVGKAQAHIALGEKAEAQTLLETAIEVDPKHEKAYLLLYEILVPGDDISYLLTILQKGYQNTASPTIRDLIDALEDNIILIVNRTTSVLGSKISLELIYASDHDYFVLPFEWSSDNENLEVVILQDGRAQLSMSHPGVATVTISFGSVERSTTVEFVESPVGGVLIRASIGNPVLFNPILSSDTASSAIEGHIFEGLVRYDENMQRVGALAYDWDISDNNLEWTFFLRENVTWHDGMPFTSADVEFTIGTVTFNPDYPGPRASMFNLLEEIVVVDDYTITFILSEPFGPFMNNIGFNIIPKHIYCPVTSDQYNVAISDMFSHPVNMMPIGTGPYTYGEWKEGEYIDLIRNENYWNHPEPYIEIVLYKFVGDLATSVAALEAGEIDLVTGLPDDDLERLKRNLRNTHNFYEYQELVYDFIGFQFRDEPFLDRFGFNPFHDLRVRQAFAHAIDRQAFLDDILQGRGTLMNSHIPPNSWAYSEDVYEYQYDPDIANDLLTAAGWIWRPGDDYRTWKDNPNIVLEFELYTNIGNNRREQITVLTQQDLAEVGVKINLEWIEWATLLNNYVFTADYQLLVIGWSLGADPDAYSIFHSQQTHALNLGHYSNERVDELLVKGRTTVDIDERRGYYQEFAQIISEDLPYVFLFTRDINTAVDKKVHDITIGALGLWWFDRWYIAQD